MKSSLAFQSECGADVVQSRATELLNTGRVADTRAMMAAVDSVSASAVQNVSRAFGFIFLSADTGSVGNIGDPNCVWYGTPAEILGRCRRRSLIPIR